MTDVPPPPTVPAPFGDAAQEAFDLDGFADWVIDQRPQELMRDPERYADALARFVTGSPSSFHVAALMARVLRRAGFVELQESEDWSAAGAGGRLVVRDGAVIAWWQNDDGDPAQPFRVLGAHSDSPGFRVKPGEVSVSNGWQQVGVEVYGGVVLPSWFDRELELAGRVVTSDGKAHLVRTGPVARIPQLAVHLDRSLHTEHTVDKQRDTQPVLATLADGELTLTEMLADAAGLSPAAVLAYDLVLADAQQPRLFGARGSLLASGRLDNLSSVLAGLLGLLSACDSGDAAAGGPVPVLAVFDHEEVGSGTRSGAAGPLLSTVLERVFEERGARRAEAARALAASWCLSSDAGHGVHPNRADVHDPQVQPHLGGGALLKINANQRYATDAVGAALWAEVCTRAGAASQQFVSNNSVPCGSTIGPLTATRLGIPTLDVGVPLLSMHSARELAHTSDLAALARLAAAFFTIR